MSTWDMIMGYDPPPGVQAAIDEKERRETAEQNIADSAAALKELSTLLEQEHQARIEAQKQAEAEAKAKAEAEAAKAALKVATVEINKAGSKGVYHKNTCSRKISRLAKAVNSIA